MLVLYKNEVWPYINENDFFLCNSSAALERCNINPSSEGRKVKVATLDRDFGKLMMSTSFDVCDGERGQDEEKGRNLLGIGMFTSRKCQQLPDLKRGERTALLCFF